MIKIITGHSDMGGSSHIFVNLTNLFNKNGIDCTMYGPHMWHLNKCKSGLLSQISSFNRDDIIIAHYLQIPQRPDVKKIVLACHEKWWFSVGDVKQYWDTVIFSHEEHRKYHHKYTGPYVTIPNPREEHLIKRNKKKIAKVAGVIGTVEDRKQTHISVQRALDDGCDRVYIFGQVADVEYYKQYISPLTFSPKVILKGYVEDKQLMYDMIGRVYHSSKGEVACLVKDECVATGTAFYGNEETAHTVTSLNNQEILNLWKSVLEI